MYDRTVSTLVAVAAVVGIVVGAVWLSQHVSWGCILGTCAVITH